MRTTNAGAVDPNNFNRVITAIGDWNISKVVITRNGGLSWTFVDGTEGGLPAFAAFHPTNPDVAYTGRFKFTNFIPFTKRIFVNGINSKCVSTCQ